MKKFTVALITLFFIHNQVSAQHDTAFKNFMQSYKEMYLHFEKTDNGNFFNKLADASSYAFNFQNPEFVTAIKSFSNSTKLYGTPLMDSFFKKGMNQFREDYVWLGAENLYNEYKEWFIANNEFMCACLSDKITAEDKGEKLMKGIQTCNVKMATDTTYLNKIKKITGTKTINELYSASKQAFRYLYKHCEVIYNNFSQTIYNSPVYERYTYSLEVYLSSLEEKANGFFKRKNYDSLKLLFPGFSRYTNELTKIANYCRGKKIIRTLRNYHEGKEETITYDVVYGPNKKTGMLPASCKIVFSTNDVNAKIISVKFQPEKKFNMPKDGIEEQIIIVPSEKQL